MKEATLNVIKEFLTLIGVVCGFLLATIKDIITTRIQNKPKLKLELKTGRFNYYKEFMDSSAISRIVECPSQDANYLILEVAVDIFNYGKGNTAIKDVMIETKAYGKTLNYLQPEMKINESLNTNFSFNLPSNSIVTMNLKLKIEKNEYLGTLFDVELSLSPEDKDSLKFFVITKDIKNRETRLKIDPLSILTAF